MEILRAIEQELRADPDLMADIRQMASQHRNGRHANVQASDVFIHGFLNHAKEGARLYCFFEEFRNRRGLNQRECPKRYFLTVLRTLMTEVTGNA